MINLQKQLNKRIEKTIHTVAFVLSDHNLSDCFAKVNTNICLVISLRFGTISRQ